MRGRFIRKSLWGASRVVKKLRNVFSHLYQQDAVDVIHSAVSDTIARTDLNGQVIIITGSTHGVGLALATAFATAKAKVVINGRTATSVDQAVQGIQGAGGAAIGVAADISTEDGAKRLVETTVDRLGRVDLLINNAALSGPHGRRALHITPIEWQEVLSVNLTGPFLCARFVGDWMIRHGVSGRIINVSSGAARTPVRGLSPYIASKAALEGLTRALALDLEENGIMVAGVQLGSVQTRMSRPFFSWDDFQGLPPPESVVPIFLYAATAPRERLHGRILAAWRFEKDPEGESILTGPLSVAERATLSPLCKGDQAVNGTRQGLVRLDRAENPQGMSGRARALLNRGGEDFDLSRYPDEHYRLLRNALSERLGLPPDCFTFGNGSSELVERTLRTFTQPGDEVISNEPSWFMFDRFCNIFGIINRKIPFLSVGSNGPFDHNLDAVANAISSNTRLIYLVSPSNPLGIGISAQRFARFLDRLPTHIPIIVDEAYLEYSTHPETLRSHEIILHTDRRVIGLRTFSKFYGLAGLRIGYAFAAPGTLRLINRLEPLFVLSSLAEAAAVAALEDKEHAALTLRDIGRERERIQERLTSVGIRHVRSETNFMLVESPASPEEICRAFEDQGILIPKGLVMDRYIVFPIAGAEQNDRNLRILCSF